jgi:hypothetical protein
LRRPIGNNRPFRTLSRLTLRPIRCELAISQQLYQKATGRMPEWSTRFYHFCYFFECWRGGSTWSPKSVITQRGTPRYPTRPSVSCRLRKICTTAQTATTRRNNIHAASQTVSSQEYRPANATDPRNKTQKTTPGIQVRFGFGHFIGALQSRDVLWW